MVRSTDVGRLCHFGIDGLCRLLGVPREFHQGVGTPRLTLCVVFLQ